MTNTLTGAERFIAQWRQSTAEGNLYSPDDLATYIMGPATVPGNGRQVTTLATYLANNAIANVKDFGAKGDGVTDDTATIQAAITYCFGTSGSPHGLASVALNVPLYFPAGTYKITDELTLPKVVGGQIRGAGRFVTNIQQTTINKAVFRTNGFAYSVVEGLHLETVATSTSAIFELDWDNTSGGQALQSNTFRDILFEGNAKANYGVRVGASGFMGSENAFINCFFANCVISGLEISNFNALQNTVIGGDFQGCTKYGIHVFSGSVHVFSVGFQNAGAAAVQVTNDGYDIAIDNSANDISTIRGCRSESFRFLHATGLHRIVAEGNAYTPSVNRWAALTGFTVNTLATGTTTNGDGKLYKCTTPGTSGAAEPTWTGATVSDGSVVWTLIDFTIVNANAHISLRYNNLPLGTILCSGNNEAVPAEIVGNIFSRTDWCGAATYGGSLNSFLRLDQNVVLQGALGQNSGGALQAYRAQSSGYGSVLPQAVSYMMNLGLMPLLWSRGTGGVIYGDVGFVPADGSATVAARNVLGLIGTIGAPTSTAANTAGTDTIITGGQGTGTGISGKLRLRAAPAGSTGSTPNTPVDIAIIDEAGVSLATAGFGFKVKEGTNATMGTAVLVAGTLVVSTTKVTSTSRIYLTTQAPGGTPGWLQVSARSAGTSFTILSSSGTDTSTVAWLIVEPA